MFAENICKLFHISDPVAKGVESDLLRACHGNIKGNGDGRD